LEKVVGVEKREVKERKRKDKNVKEIKEFVSKSARGVLVGYKLHASHAAMGITLQIGTRGDPHLPKSMP
jgi:hypothetical protein